MTTSENVGIVLYLSSDSDRPPISDRRVSHNIKYLRLLFTLYQMMGIDSNQYLLKISTSLSENNRSHLIPINNDDDLWFFFTPDTRNHYVHLHVDTEGLQSNIVPDIPVSNEFYQYALYLRGYDIINYVGVTQGLESIEINDFAAKTSMPTHQDVHIERTNTFTEDLSEDQCYDSLIDSFGAMNLKILNLMIMGQIVNQTRMMWMLETFRLYTSNVSRAHCWKV